ncbi:MULTISPECIES: glycogen debranching protein GlgX [Acidianus]|uniref:Glycogen debranching protein n=1 Tax=Candidatus Acidianus copahuensis TaxID=1160895 RepID=A0A031LMC0_9CREN|nr:MULTISPECIES: glycogen debranching protein GlgX [Acidianus]EZQ02048.1 glycogen debranching protein [Candidatus Acidianus copahuensis]NON63298.1 glycogen debranching protein GlgX [Acidianus sp. RZ1]
MAIVSRPVRPGEPYPIGATVFKDSVNFTIFSENATGVQLLLFSHVDDKEPKEVIDIKERTGDLWHVQVPGLLQGQLYAYKVDGPYKPENGHRFNKNKALIDPYAKAVAGLINWDDSLFSYKIGDQNQDMSFDERDSTPFIPKSVVVSGDFDWEGERPLSVRVPWSQTSIYEAHVKGITKLREDVDENLRGTYSGLASKPIISYLKDMGITTLELMPVQQFVRDKWLLDQGLTNYWGYNPIAYFAPDCGYSSSGCQGEQVIEFKKMVKELHSAGIEVIIDVVYNHTGEGNHLGPTLSFKGIDNASYYMLNPDNPRFYMDFTGTGNTFNLRHPRVLQLVMDSLRYWVLEMHVDGFRFDLASALARELYSVNMLSTFFVAIQQDPVLSRVKLIAEPWDVGEGGYQVGNFPYQWAEWNGKYRDIVRRFWRGEQVQYGELANRLMGSPDLYLGSGRTPFASINYITSHDGFTLQDLVSYNQKHNEENKMDNKDGMEDNLSWNCGYEGETQDPNVLSCRERQKRNFITTLLISQGVPMILGGDELSRTQRGNNNAFCQDNEISWYNWNLDDKKKAFRDFVKSLVYFRKAHPIFRRRKFFQGRKLFGSPFKDITWLSPSGSEIDDRVWNSPTQTIAFILSGDAMDEVNERGERVADYTFLIILNGNPNPIKFKVPKIGSNWELVLWTIDRQAGENDKIVKAEQELEIEGRSAVIYRRT